MTAVRYLPFDRQEPPTELVLEGVELDEHGDLRLAIVPAEPQSLPAGLDPAAALGGPAGIGVAEDGDLYVADPAGNRIIRIACDGSAHPLPCLTEGTAPGQVRGPRGVVVGPGGTLYVADSGNHRVQVLDLRTLQVRDVLGQPDAYAEPEPSAEPGRFDDPWDLAVDSHGDLYVVDHGNRRVQKFGVDGRELAGFRQTIQANSPLEPVAVATTVQDGKELLLVLDGSRPGNEAGARLLVYELDGTFVEELEGVGDVLGAGAAGLVAAGGVFYVGAPEQGRVLVFDLAGHFLGATRGYAGPVAGIALDCFGRLIVHTGGGPLSVLDGRAYAAAGTLVLGPIPVGAQVEGWRRLRALAAPQPVGTSVRVFTLGAENELATPGLLESGAWRPGPAGALDLLVTEQTPYLWIAVRLESDGQETPVIRQLVLESEPETWLRFLPAVYRRDDRGREALERILGLFESVLRDDEALLDDLPLLFDAAAAPNDHAPVSWLDWLSGWLAVELEEAWSEDRRRFAVAGAFARHGKRGTVEGLREVAELYLDAPVHVVEPAGAASLFTIGESELGFSTMLIPAEAEGAVVGTTAFVDHSNLLGDEDIGSPLFDDLAHRFCVHVYGADLRPPGTKETLVRVIDREKPAHTTYHLCVIEPRLRVGFQARIGVDSIIGAGPGDPRMPAGFRLGLDTQLPETAARPNVGAIGVSARVGTTALT